MTGNAHGWYDIAALVRQFHESFRLPMADAPELVDGGLTRQRHQLLLQEVTEVYDAVLHNNLPGIAQELADCVYVLYGTALVYGIDLDAVLLAVHAANMTKLFPDGTPHTLDGKVVKGPNYAKPDIAAVLARQAEPTQQDAQGFGPWHQLTVIVASNGATLYDLHHPAECDRLPYGVHCSLDEPGDDHFDWPLQPGEYTICSWGSKTWTDMGWSYDGGVQWERGHDAMGQAQGERDLAGNSPEAQADVQEP